MKFPKIFPEKNLHETDMKVISDDFKNRSDFLASTLVDTNRKLDALSALLANFELKPQKDEIVPKLVTSAEMVERIDTIERRVDSIETLMHSILVEVKAIRQNGEPPQIGYPVYPGTNIPMPGQGVPMQRAVDPMPNPYYQVTCDHTDGNPCTATTQNIPGVRRLTEDPEFQKGFKVEPFPANRRDNDPAYEDHMARYNKYDGQGLHENNHDTNHSEEKEKEVKE